MQVIFNRPLKVGKKAYPKSKAVVKLDDKLKDDWFVKHHISEGGISVVAPAAAAPAKKAKADAE